MPASPIGNHSNWEIIHAIQNRSYNPLSLRNQITHDTNDRLVLIYFYRAQNFQFLQDMAQVSQIIYRHRNSHL